ncbi:MAG: FkbM family methyltransferase [Sphingobacteriales bacterium]|nr:MAG: FkbM family methyltransferase [Sphingobacteriales bacterium]
MGEIAASYKPSLLNFSKYSVYANYFKEFVVCNDFRSLGVSINYVLTHRTPPKDYITSSKMGKFQIRKGTTDFQFINWTYEGKVKDYIQDNIDSFDVFIDVGACIGEYCIWLARMGKQCIAIEPVNFEAVRNNIRLNGLADKVKLFACGLGSKKEKVFFNIPKGITSSSHINRETQEAPNVTIEVLDQLYTQFGISPNARILLKLDVEGMETEVISGGTNFIKGSKNISIIYEHFVENNFQNDKALLAIGEFDIHDIDGVNRVAIKR